MSNIQDRIKQIDGYFLNMNVGPSDNGGFYMYIEVAFPPKWTISKTLTEKYGIKIIPNESKNGYYFLGDFSLGHDTIFDCIDENIKINQDAEKRVELFRKKQEELKNLFEDMTVELSTLETLEFKMSGKKKGLPKALKKEMIPVSEDTITENNTELQETEIEENE